MTVSFYNTSIELGDRTHGYVNMQELATMYTCIHETKKWMTNVKSQVGNFDIKRLV